ncbi:substrate-binding domain-containing protein [Paenibacillus sp.]|uniref:substrate-binding domain-containing protein n=1 Tax=Paenibacillus sp. TaxID=58172 RepID=UPI002D3F61CC|nr:substrate-binding domain-containing protein [Paenibacillus sp.]HZG84084.1 substrate-binding domain-containing protein [Paenibacillus sp.]
MTSKSKSKLLWNIGLAALLLALAACLAQVAETARSVRDLVGVRGEGESVGAPRAVLVSQEADNPFWRAVERGAREAAAQGGWLLEYAGPRRIDPEEQLRLLDKAIASGADAILVQGIGDERFRRLIDDAVRRGIVVITVDTDEPGSARQAYVGSNNEQAGETVGLLVAEASRGRGAVGVLIGDERAPNQIQRLEGFRRAIARYPGLAIADVAASSISRLRAAAEAERMLREHPEIGFMVGFSSLDGIGIGDAAERAGLPLPNIYAFDDVPETMAGIAGCRIAATIQQQPARMGELAMELARQGAAGQPLPEYNYTAADVVTADPSGAGGHCS